MTPEEKSNFKMRVAEEILKENGRDHMMSLPEEERQKVWHTELKEALNDAKPVVTVALLAMVTDRDLGWVGEKTPQTSNMALIDMKMLAGYVRPGADRREEEEAIQDAMETEQGTSSLPHLEE